MAEMQKDAESGRLSKSRKKRETKISQTPEQSTTAAIKHPRNKPRHPIDDATTLRLQSHHLPGFGSAAFLDENRYILISTLIL